eukprot:6188307-Pleurochrysis_carterae.AAC.2
MLASHIVGQAGYVAFAAVSRARCAYVFHYVSGAPTQRHRRTDCAHVHRLARARLQHIRTDPAHKHCMRIPRMCSRAH